MDVQHECGYINKDTSFLRIQDYQADDVKHWHTDSGLYGNRG